MLINKSVLRAASTTSVAIVLLTVQPLGAQTSSDAERLQKLEKAVEQLQTRNAELEQEVESLKKETALPPPAPAESRTTYDGKTYVEKTVATKKEPKVDVKPGGPEIKLTLGGVVQANFESGDVSAFEGRFGLNALKDRFRLRRVKIRMTGEFAENFDFKIEGNLEQSDSAITAIKSVDFANGKITTVTNSNRTEFSGTDIFVNWHQFPEAQIKVGQWKAPFGLEQLTPDEAIFTIERSLPTGAITPERQIGAQIWGKPLTNILPDEKDLVTYYAGIFNGNGRNFNNNDNNEYMYVGRLELLPFKGKLLGQDSSLKLGADVLNSRDDAGTNISQTLNLKVNADGSLSPFTLPSPDERTAWSVDAWLELGRFDLIGEYLQEHVEGRTVNGVPPTFSNFTTDGFYVTGAFYLLPKKLQAVVQWQYLNPGQKGNDGLYSILGGLNYYIRGDDLKLMVNYIHTWSDFRQVNPKFGEDQFDEVIGRLQLMF